MKKFFVVLLIALIGTTCVFAQETSTVSTASDDLFALVDGTEVTANEAVTVDGGVRTSQTDTYDIPDTRYQIPDTRYQIPDTRYQIPDTDAPEKQPSKNRTVWDDVQGFMTEYAKSVTSRVIVNGTY